jgi:hypothetical protein
MSLHTCKSTLSKCFNPTFQPTKGCSYGPSIPANARTRSIEESCAPSSDSILIPSFSFRFTWCKCYGFNSHLENPQEHLRPYHQIPVEIFRGVMCSITRGVPRRSSKVYFPGYPHGAGLQGPSLANIARQHKSQLEYVPFGWIVSYEHLGLYDIDK